MVMLAVLVPRAYRLLVPAWRSSTLLWIAAAGGVTLIGGVLATLRWQRGVSALDLNAGIPPPLKHYLAGLFVSNFLPTTIGGDVLRVSRLSGDTGESPRSFASVVLERLTGWVVLPVITLVTLLINPGLLRPPVDHASHIAILISFPTPRPVRFLPLLASSPPPACWVSSSSPLRRIGSASGYASKRDGCASSTPSTSAWPGSAAAREVPSRC